MVANTWARAKPRRLHKAILQLQEILFLRGLCIISPYIYISFHLISFIQSSSYSTSSHHSTSFHHHLIIQAIIQHHFREFWSIPNDFQFTCLRTLRSQIHNESMPKFCTHLGHYHIQIWSNLGQIEWITIHLYHIAQIKPILKHDLVLG